jgi:hypothetical protein
MLQNLSAPREYTLDLHAASNRYTVTRADIFQIYGGSLTNDRVKRLTTPSM